MMMNFLDLSAASDEERRFISEILSDTSIVNFAQPLRQQQSTYNQAQLQQPLEINQLGQQDQNQHHHQSQQHIVKNKVAHSPYQQTQQPPQLQQNHTASSTNSTNDPNQRLNHVHDHNTPVTSDNHHHTNHVQMPSPMAGDMNRVVGIDMSTSQHAGYPMGHPTSAHVATTYGPPPPHHMYGGPPIFQHYPMPLPYPNLVYGNMPHYPLLLATNSVVPPRQQQVPSQTNPPPNATIATSSYSRSHSHHSRQVKPKEHTSKQNSIHHNQHATNHPNAHHIQYMKSSNNIEINDTNVKNSASNHDDFKPKINNSRLQDDAVSLGESSSLVTNNDVNVNKESSTNGQQQIEATKTDNNSDQANYGAEVVEVSSDESLEAQTTSLDGSKSMQAKSMPIVDKSNISSLEADSNNTVAGEPSASSEAVDQSNIEKATQQGPWGSASSKSWASLFKGEGGAIVSSSINGESEDNNDVNNSDEDIDRYSHRKAGNSEDIAQNSSRAVSSKEQRSQDAARKALDKMAPRLAQKIKSITLKHSLPLLRPRGFINKGNGCYINSTLQALIACPPFYNLMKEIGDLKCLRRENSCTPILDSFAELFLNFPPLDANKKNKQFTSSDQRMQIGYLQADALEPKCIYDVLGQIKSECLRGKCIVVSFIGAQEDAEEFLSSVLNGLHEEMIGLCETLQSIQNNNSNSQNGHHSDIDDLNGDANNDDNVWREVGSKNRSLPIRTATVVKTPIQEIFGGSLFSIRTAGKDKCGHLSPFFDLQLDISGDNVKTLQDAIKSFTAPEIIHDFYCSKTKQKLDAQRRTSLDQLPPILILHLKQFIYTQDHGLRKLMKRIEYPIDFELPDSCLHDKNSDKSQRTSRTYKLLAVVYHEGKEAVKGHYLTDVYHIGSSQWIRCDDSNLKVVPAPRIDNPDSSRTPYLLFYRRLNTLKPQQSNNIQHDNNKKKS